MTLTISALSRRIILAFGLTLVLSPLADADSFTSSTSGGHGSASESLSYEGSHSNKDLKNLNQPTSPVDLGALNWNLGFDYSQMGGTDPRTDAPVLEKTYTFKGGLGYEANEAWNFGGGLMYSTTPVELLQSVSPNAYVGYTYKFKDKTKKGPDNDQDDDSFIPSVGAKLTGSISKYSLSSITGKKSVNRELSSTISQRSAEFELDATPIELLSISGTYTTYGYDKDPAQFASSLGSAKSVSVQHLTAGLANASNGFPSYSTGVSTTFYPIEHWEFEPGIEITKTKSDGSVAHAYKANLSHDFTEQWTGGIGAEKDVSPTLSQYLGSVAITYNTK